LGGQSHVKIPFCRLELEFNSNERREFRMAPKSVWPVFLMVEQFVSIHAAIGASELAEISPDGPSPPRRAGGRIWRLVQASTLTRCVVRFRNLSQSHER
jgi:hypothetical protein